MKLKYILLSLSITAIAATGYAENSVNTEDNPAGIVQISDMMADKAMVKADKELLQTEKQQYRAEKRISWVTKVINKRMAKSSKKAVGSGQNTMSLLSLIGGVGSWLFLFIPYLGLLALVMAIGGLVLGIVSMKKEGSNAMNILGIVFSGTLLLLFIAAVIIVASWGWI